MHPTKQGLSAGELNKEDKLNYSKKSKKSNNRGRKRY